MALVEDDYFVENILDDPDDLERVEGFTNDEDHENEGAEDGKKENEDQQMDKKKTIRRKSQQPKLNIIRLMDKNGLTAIEKCFSDVNLKGKGFEREDLNLIMRKIEIWAHQMFPSLQFDDCLGKLEKLGSDRSVMTYVKKIRMGVEDAVPNVNFAQYDSDCGDDLASHNNLVSEVAADPFDQLINKQSQQSVMQSSNTPSGLTAEQRERMSRNRLIAEQRRMARKKVQEQQQQQENNVDNEKIEFLNQDIVVNNGLSEAIQPTDMPYDTASNTSPMNGGPSEAMQPTDILDETASNTSPGIAVKNNFQSHENDDTEIHQEQILERTQEII